MYNMIHMYTTVHMYNMIHMYTTVHSGTHVQHDTTVCPHHFSAGRHSFSCGMPYPFLLIVSLLLVVLVVLVLAFYPCLSVIFSHLRFRSSPSLVSFLLSLVSLSVCSIPLHFCCFVGAVARRRVPLQAMEKSMAELMVQRQEQASAELQTFAKDYEQERLVPEKRALQVCTPSVTRYGCDVRQPQCVRLAIGCPSARHCPLHVTP